MVLREYAADTKRIANAGVTQTENAQMPFLTAFDQPATAQAAGRWVIANQGFGPAINGKWKQIQADAVPRFILSLAPGTRSPVLNDFHEAIGSHWEVQLDYESLSGLKYRTVITWEGAVMHTQFHKLP